MFGQSRGVVKIISVQKFNEQTCPLADSVCFVMDYAESEKFLVKLVNKTYRLLSLFSFGRKMLGISPVKYIYELASKHRKISKILSKKSVNHVYFISNHDKDLFFQNMVTNWDAGRQIFYQERFDDVVRVGNLFSDNNSREIFQEYLRTYCENKVYSGEHVLFRYKYFYGSNEKEVLYKHLNNEVWLNCGAGRGETVFAYLSEGFTFKKIYAVDADDEELDSFRKDIKFLPESKRKNVEIIQKKIDNSSDVRDIIGDNKLTLLNADIEGAETQLLHGIIDIIKKDRPVLSICVYHKMEDSLYIPLYLSNELSDYVFFLRKYVSSATCKKRNNELVFFAIPQVCISMLQPMPHAKTASLARCFNLA